MLTNKIRLASMVVFGTALTLSGLTACSSNTDNADSTDTSTTQTTSDGTSAEPAPGTCEIEEGNLRIYMNPWGSTMTDKFTEDTGIETDDADLGGGEILARIAAEANNPQWDVVVLDGHGSLEAMRQQGQLLENPPVHNLDNLNEMAQELLPEDHTWIPLSEHAAAVIAYNTDLVPADNAPETWADLTDPAYAPVGIADPAIAAPAYPIVSWFFQDLGEDAAREYFETLNTNGLNTYDKNGPVGNAVASGAVATAMLQEQNVFELLDAGEPVAFVWPDDGAPAAIRAAAISAETPRPCAAAALVDWLTDPDNVTYLMENDANDGIISPYIVGTDTSSLPAQRPDVPRMLITDAEFAAEHEADIKDWFANLQVSN